MTWAADITDSMADLFEFAGEVAEYRPAGGDPVACHVFVRQASESEPAGFPSRLSQREYTLEARPDELGQTPAPGDVFAVGSKTWTLTPRILEDSGPIFRAVVE
ncbi:MAG: hypothetical protein ABIJ95_03300 [Pseudomonadota bacterium]